MNRDKKDKLNGDVHINENLIGGFSSAVGRSTETKEALMVAVEILPDGRTGNLSLEHIESFKADELKFAIKKMVSNDEAIKTDAYHSYKN